MCMEGPGEPGPANPIQVFSDDSTDETINKVVAGLDVISFIYPGGEHRQRTMGLFLVRQIRIVHLPEPFWKMRCRLWRRYPLDPEGQEARRGLDGRIRDGMSNLRRDRYPDTFEAAQTAYTDYYRR